jgi:hypothetical protein
MLQLSAFGMVQKFNCSGELVDDTVCLKLCEDSAKDSAPVQDQSRDLPKDRE